MLDHTQFLGVRWPKFLPHYWSLNKLCANRRREVSNIEPRFHAKEDRKYLEKSSIFLLSPSLFYFLLVRQALECLSRLRDDSK